MTLNDHIAWCGALGCRRIAIIFEGEGPVCGREGWHRVGGGQTHGANAVMVVGDIRVMSHQKVKRANISFTLPPRPWRPPRTHLGPNLRLILCQVLGPHGTNQGLAGRNRALKKTNQSLAGWNGALRDEPGP